jgi:putative membrane protein
MRSFPFALVIAALVAASSVCVAAEDVAKADPAASQPAGGSQTFLKKAVIGSMAEVELGKLAEERAGSAAVKAFGQQMVADHSKASQELRGLAAKQDVPLPAALDAKHKALRDRLAKLSGSSFDRAYMTEMISDHEKDVAEFRREAKNATDPAIKSFASATLPVLEGHLKRAQQVKASL